MLFHGCTPVPKATATAVLQARVSRSERRSPQSHCEIWKCANRGRRRRCRLSPPPSPRAAFEKHVGADHEPVAQRHVPRWAKQVSRKPVLRSCRFVLLHGFTAGFSTWSIRSSPCMAHHRIFITSASLVLLPTPTKAPDSSVHTTTRRVPGGAIECPWVARRWARSASSSLVIWVNGSSLSGSAAHG